MTNINVIKTLYGLKTVEQQLPIFYSSMAEYYESKVDDLKGIFAVNEQDAKSPFVSVNIDGKAWVLQAGSVLRALDSDRETIDVMDIAQEQFEMNLDKVAQYIADDISVCKSNAALYSYLATISPNTPVDSSKLIDVISSAVPINEWDDRIRDIISVFTTNSSLTPTQYSIIVAEEFEQVKQEVSQRGEFKYDAYAISGINLFTAALAEAVDDITNVFEKIFTGLKRIQDLGNALVQTLEFLATKVIGEKLKGLKVDFETVPDSMVDGFDVPIAAFSVTFDMLCQMILLPHTIATKKRLSGLSTPYFLNIPASSNDDHIKSMIQDVLATTASVPYAMKTYSSNEKLISDLQDFLSEGQVLTMALDPSLLMSIFISGDKRDGEDVYRIHIYAMNYSTVISQIKYDIMGECYCSYGVRQSVEVDNIDDNESYIRAILRMLDSGKWMWSTPISARTDYLGDFPSHIPLLLINNDTNGNFYLKDEYGGVVTPANVFFDGDVSQIDTPAKLIAHIRFKLMDVDEIVKSDSYYQDSLYNWFSDLEYNWDPLGSLGWTDKYNNGQMLGFLYICSLLWKHFSLMFCSNNLDTMIDGVSYSSRTQDLSQVTCVGFVDGSYNEAVYTPYVTNRYFTFSVHLQTAAERVEEASYIVKAVLLVIVAAAAAVAVNAFKRKLRSSARLLSARAYTNRMEAQTLYASGEITAKQCDKILRRSDLNDKIANLLNGKSIGAASFQSSNLSASLSAIIKRIG